MTLESGTPKEMVVVPQSALIADQEGVYVFVVEDGKAVVKRIKPGGESGTDTVVQEGLSGNEQVIVEGLQGVRPGAPVKASPRDDAQQELIRCSPPSSSIGRGSRSSSPS